MKIPGLKTLKLSARWLRSKFFYSALILGYHSVDEAPWDPFSLCVKPQHFSKHLEVIRKQANPITLHELVQSLKNGRVPPRAVAVTFDDGYADNLYNAKPLLEHYEIPATAFVAAGHMGREFWWDELAGILLTPASLPEKLDLTVNGRTFQRTLADGADTKLREQLLLSLYNLLQSSPVKERQKSIAELRAWTSVAPRVHNYKRALKPDEIIKLANGGLIEVGAHTMEHPLLATLPRKAQQAEIRESKLCLEELLGRTVTSFSYPNGSLSEETLRIVRDSGFFCACGSYKDVVWRCSDRFKLPRFWIPDWDGKKFSRWLSRWLRG